MLYSLDEIEKITGMNRRKIQEYEKQGLSRKPEQEKKKSHKRCMMSLILMSYIDSGFIMSWIIKFLR